MSRCCFGIVGAVLNVSGRSQLCGLVSGMSPWRLGAVSMVFQWCLGDVFCDVSVLCRWCVSDVSVMSRVCVSDVSVWFGWCVSDVLVLSRRCFGDMSVMSLALCQWCFHCLSNVSVFSGGASVLFQWCLGDALVMSRWDLGYVSVILWWCVKMFSACASDVLVIFKGCVGDVLGVSRWCVVIVLWCFGDMWMMPWFCVGDVSALCRWCFGVSVTGGDAAVMFWSWFVMFRWRTLMSIFRFSVGSDAKSMAVPCVFAIGVVCWANFFYCLYIPFPFWNQFFQKTLPTLKSYQRHQRPLSLQRWRGGTGCSLSKRCFSARKSSAHVTPTVGATFVATCDSDMNTRNPSQLPPTPTMITPAEI